jgi:phospholipid/cholesterol/gamma-HCH transport system ATP-binding protein
MTTRNGTAVRLDHVSKAFGTFAVLDDVTMEIARGIGFGILGRSGTGKSVMLKHIVGLLKPDTGRVIVEGKDITHMTSGQLTPVRKRIGFLFQNAALFDSITVGENVAFPMRRHTEMSDEEIRTRAQQKMPADLSGGMRKRAGLARAMALDPSILLADEPSAGLDPITSAEIDALLVDLKRQGSTTLIAVTHNIPSARRIADELVFLHEGTILVQGTAAELDRSNDPLVKEFMRSEGAG